MVTFISMPFSTFILSSLWTPNNSAVTYTSLDNSTTHPSSFKFGTVQTLSWFYTEGACELSYSCICAVALQAIYRFQLSKDLFMQQVKWLNTVRTAWKPTANKLRFVLQLTMCCWYSSVTWGECQYSSLNFKQTHLSYSPFRPYFHSIQLYVT
jgi:hypothetical protein